MSDLDCERCGDALDASGVCHICESVKSHFDEVIKLREDNEQLKEENRTIKKTLGIYAEPNNWDKEVHDQVVSMSWCGPNWRKPWELACKALSGEP